MDFGHYCTKQLPTAPGGVVAPDRASGPRPVWPPDQPVPRPVEADGRESHHPRVAALGDMTDGRILHDLGHPGQTHRDRQGEGGRNGKVGL